jgi:hypothetical protein
MHKLMTRPTQWNKHYATSLNGTGEFSFKDMYILILNNSLLSRKKQAVDKQPGHPTSLQRPMARNYILGNKPDLISRHSKCLFQKRVNMNIHG